MDHIDRIWSVSKGVVKASLSLPKRQPWRLQGFTAGLRQKIDRFPVRKTSRRIATTKGTPACRCDPMWHDVTMWFCGLLQRLVLKQSDEKSVDEMLVFEGFSCEKSSLEKNSENKRELQPDSFSSFSGFIWSSMIFPFGFAPRWSPFSISIPAQALITLLWHTWRRMQAKAAGWDAELDIWVALDRHLPQMGNASCR